MAVNSPHLRLLKTGLLTAIIFKATLETLLLLHVLRWDICERIWEKGPNRAKTKLKLRVYTPVRVNLVKIFFCSMTKNYLFPIFSPN